ncbi:C45 family peptidase [Flammeovirga sp. SJP92]|uniref:C45 family autoproteolytic acyltransferase/hydolase n=1 Tax=Flammeovirga sp. SJP92 TaxID=1775430 RepID=UPI00078828B3|nr:C45 family peptidase [Flammeovirga sp. SJP92]KXX71683.1 hypothetical protein AVL50_05260 [Flammeovirga sp. SJP92]
MKKKHFILLTLLAIGIIWCLSWLFISPPALKDYADFEAIKVDTVAENHFTLGKNFLKKKNENLWEMYSEGEPYEIGYSTGILAQGLLYRQEKAFVSQINELIPSKNYLSFLRVLIAFFNRNLDASISEEYCQEIYGMSKGSNEEFNYIGPAYQRLLNYHGAHDIGHALQELALVGCTSFAVKGDKTDDGKLLVGRNFDFYVGDEFAKEKMIHFVNPKEGYKFASVTWGGFVGVVSGMNETGLTVTINAAESELPTSAATPISLIAREILQYAKTTEEAYQIALRRQGFVSEAILVTSAIDRKALSIEKSPSAVDSLYDQNNQLLTTNHYKTASMKSATAYDNAYASYYRMERLKEMINDTTVLGVEEAAFILRDKRGLKNTDIGLGNEKAINQLIAHHSIIFKPETKEMWLSTSHFQLGEYIHYNLDSVFKNAPISSTKSLAIDSLNIAEDPFVQTEQFKGYLTFKKLVKKYRNLDEEERLTQAEIDDFIALNPSSYYSHEIIGDYYAKRNQTQQAINYYQNALTKEVASHHEKANIEKKLSELQGQTK